ncbi:MAG: hypothetical protein EOM36_03345 [Bacteroidia bacterium]|jgi:hypothetical protein|nr:hypothetical protein [Bacteroidia bacterium]
MKKFENKRKFERRDSLGKIDKLMSVFFITGSLVFGLSAIIRVFLIKDHSYPLAMNILLIIATILLLISAGWCLGRWVNPYGILLKK